MLVLGLQGSPRKKGNTDYLLSTFMKEVEKTGARTETIDAPRKNIEPCKGCAYCEKRGFCVIEDDEMTTEIYPLLRQADAIVASTPIFFYAATAQLKALIDRSQALWSRRYCMKLSDPKKKFRRGYLLSLGATKGKNLFEGLNLTTKYFFDAVGAEFNGSLTYRRIEHRGDMEKHPTVKEDVKKSVDELLAGLIDRKKILFACRENACRSQMASAFAQFAAGHKIEAFSAGSGPAETVNSDMIEAMAEKSIDMEYRTPKSIETATADRKPDIVVTMGCGEACPVFPGARVLDWDLPDPAGKPIDFMRNVRDEIEKKVSQLVDSID